MLHQLIPRWSIPVNGRASWPTQRSIAGNDHFLLNLVMPTCKLALDAARDMDGATMVVAIARNGMDFGIQVSGIVAPPAVVFPAALRQLAERARASGSMGE